MKPFHRSRLRRIAGAAAVLLAAGVQAETSPYYIGVTETYSHESNLLRLADGVMAPDGFSRSDSLWTTALIAGFDQPFGRQHGYANLSVRDTHYSRNSTYNNLGYTGTAGLDWSTAGRLSGSLVGTAQRQLYAFNSGYGQSLLTQRNLQDIETVNSNFALGLVTRYSLLLSVGHVDVKNSLDDPNIKSLNYKQDSASLGLQYRPSSATQLSVTYGETRGRYPQYQLTASGYQADRFKQPKLEVGATLDPSAASHFESYIGYSKTRYDLNQPRDFSGITGRVVWFWQPRGRTRFNLRLARDTGQNAYAYTAFFGLPGTSDVSQVYTTLRLGADYDLSPKITLNAGWTVVDRKISNTLTDPFFGPRELNGKDRSQVFAVGARWAPLRSVLVGCDASTERRTASGDITSPLRNTAFSCLAQFQLQR